MSKEIKRKSTRFNSAQNTTAWVSLSPEDFSEDVLCLVVDEAFQGCGVICAQDIDLSVNHQCYVKVGKLAPVRAELRWKKRLDDQVFRLGFHFLE